MGLRSLSRRSFPFKIINTFVLVNYKYKMHVSCSENGVQVENTTGVPWSVFGNNPIKYFVVK